MTNILIHHLIFLQKIIINFKEKFKFNNNQLILEGLKAKGKPKHL